MNDKDEYNYTFFTIAAIGLLTAYLAFAFNWNIVAIISVVFTIILLAAIEFAESYEEKLNDKENKDIKK